MATYKLTKAWLDKHKASGPNDDFAWDPRLPRFGARAKPSGVKTFVYQYHAGGKTPRKSIGQYGKPWTMAGARRQAAKLLMEVDAGGDPVERMRAERSAAKTATVADLAGRYMAEIAEPTKKKRSVEEDQRNLNLHILPALGSKKGCCRQTAARRSVDARHAGQASRGEPIQGVDQPHVHQGAEPEDA